MSSRLTAVLAVAAGLAVARPAAAYYDCPGMDWVRNACLNTTSVTPRWEERNEQWSAWSFSGIEDMVQGMPTELAVSAIVDHNLCGAKDGAHADGKCSKTVHQEDAVAWNFEGTLTWQETASVNVAIAGELAIQTSAEFKAGRTQTTTVADDILHEETVSTPAGVHYKWKMVIFGMKGGKVKLGFWRHKSAEGRCCLDSWWPGDEVCDEWQWHVCTWEGKSTWTTPADQMLSQAYHYVTFEDVECPYVPPTGTPTPMPEPEPSPEPTPSGTPMPYPYPQ